MRVNFQLFLCTAIVLMLCLPASPVLFEGAQVTPATEGGDGKGGESRNTQYDIDFSVRNPSSHSRVNAIAWVDLAIPPGVLQDPNNITLICTDISSELLLGHLPDDVQLHPDGSVHRVRVHFKHTWGAQETRNYRAIVGQAPTVTGSPMGYQMAGQFNDFVLISDSGVEYQVHIDDSPLRSPQGVYYLYLVNNPSRQIRAHGSVLVRVGGNQLDPDQMSFQMYWGIHSSLMIQRSPLLTRITLTYDDPVIIHWGPGGSTIQEIVRDVDFIGAEVELTFYKGIHRVDVRSKKVINERFWNHNGFVMEFSAIQGDGEEWQGEFETVFGTNLRQVMTTTTEGPTWTRQSGSWQDLGAGGDAAPTLGDLDADGDLDLVLGGAEGFLYVFENVGTATQANLVVNTTWMQGLPSYDHSAPCLGDVDADGDLDLVLGDINGRLYIYRNKGGRTGPPDWERWWGHFDRFAMGHHTTPSFGDIDGDGDLDILVGLDDGTVTTFINSGSAADPSWSLDNAWTRHLNQGPTRSPAEGYTSPHLSDFDWDGDLDLLLGSDDGKVTYFENVGRPGNPDWSRLDVSLFAGIASGWDAANCSPVLADVDGDGDGDLIMGITDGTVLWYRFDGNTTPYKGHYNLQPLRNGTYRLMRDKDGNDGPFVVEGLANTFHDYYVLANPRNGYAIMRYLPDFDRLTYKQEYWGDLFPWAGGNVSYYPYDPVAKEYVTRGQITSNAFSNGVSAGTFISQTGTSAGFVMQPMTAMVHESTEVLLLDLERQPVTRDYDRYAEDLRDPLVVIQKPDLYISDLRTDPPAPGAGESTEVVVEVVNTGASAAKNVTVRANASWQWPEGSVDTIELGRMDIPSGGSSVFRAPLDSWCRAGSLELLAEVDVDGNVTEMDEHNNNATLSLDLLPFSIPWSDPIAATLGKNTSHHPDMVVRRDGRLYVVWETCQGLEEVDIEGRAYDPEADTWGPIETLATGSHYSVQPSLALMGDKVHLAYASNIEELRDYYRTHHGAYYWGEKFDIWTMNWDEGAWSDPLRVTFGEDVNDSDQAPDIVFGAGKLRIYYRNTHFQFYTGGNQMNNIPFQELDIHGTELTTTGWDPGGPLMSNTAGSQAWWGGPQAAPEGDGIVWLVYSTEVGNQQWDLVAGAWSSSGLIRQVQLTQSNGHDEVRPAIASSNTNPRVMVAYETTRNGNRDIAVRWRNQNPDPSRGWSQEKVLTTDVASDMKPTVICDSRGDYWVAWESMRTGNKDIFLMRFDGTDWHGPWQVTWHPGSDEQPVLAADDATGRLFVGWETDRNEHGNKDIYIRHFRPVAPVLALDEVATAYEDSPVDVTGTVTDPNDDLYEVIWDWGDGNVTSSRGSETSHVYEREGTYTVSARALDRFGLKSDLATAEVTVRNVVPTARLNGTLEVEEDQTAIFNASASFDTPSDNGTLIIEWDFGDGNGTREEPLAEEALQDHVYTASGTYTVLVTITDDDGATSTAEWNVTVFNLPPEAEAWGRVDDLEEDEEGEFGGHGTDTRSDFLRGLAFRWEWGDGSWSEELDDPMTTHAYTMSGTYVATLHVIDDDGAHGTATVNVTVGNPKPTIAVTGLSRVDEDSPINIDVYAEDNPSDLDSLEYRYEWGDGSVDDWTTLANATHSWGASGTYQVLVRVRDDDGAEAEAAHAVNVINTKPNAYGSANAQEVPEGMPVLLSAAGTTDTPSDMGSLVYEWDVETEVLWGFEVEHTFKTAGLRTIILTVRDDDGEKVTYPFTILVINRPPKASGEVTPITVKVGEPVRMDASNSTDDPWDEAGLVYKWKTGDGNEYSTSTATHTYTVPGTYEIVLEVRDGDNDKGTWNVTVTVLAEEKAEDDDGIGTSVWAAIAIVVVIGVLLAILLLRRAGGGEGTASVEKGFAEPMETEGSPDEEVAEEEAPDERVEDTDEGPLHEEPEAEKESPLHEDKE